MKNIHVLPTDKPSRLFEIFQFNFVFDKQNIYSEEYKKLHSYKNQNIYITSDEEIKVGDWYLSIDNFVRKADVIWDNVYGKCPNKKIILTTDQDLIKDGVQTIDDEFLEWFVNNPSCEWVKVELHIGSLRWSHSKNTYEIIIPKEEPKQDMKQTAVEWLEEQINKFHNWKLNPIFDENCFDEIELLKAIQQAKEMERQQINNAYDKGYKQGKYDPYFDNEDDE